MAHWKWIGLIGGGVLLAGYAAWALHPVQEVQVATAQVSEGPILRHVVATGTVQAVTTVEVGSQVAGIVQSLSADYNSVVHVGDVIARLDPSSYNLELEQAKAALSQSQADLAGLKVALDDAQVQLTRAQTLANGSLIPQSDLDAAKIARDAADAALRSGNARVLQAQSAVNQASVDLDHTIIRSPIDGIVVDREVDVGQTIAAALQSPVLFRIANDLRHIQLQVNVDESDVAELTTPETVTFQVESYPRQTFQGTLSQVRLQPVLQSTTSTSTITTTVATTTPTAPTGNVVSYTAIVDVPNDDVKLRPGMTAEVDLPGFHRENAIRIPNGALTFSPSTDLMRGVGELDLASPDSHASGRAATRSTSVWTYDGKKFTRVAVQTGLSDQQWTELLSGTIHPGDVVVTSAQLRERARM